MRFLLSLGLALPSNFLNIASAFIHSQLLRAFQAEELNRDDVMNLIESAGFWHVELDKEGLEQALRKTIDRLAQESRGNPESLPLLRNFGAAVQMTLNLPFSVNLYQAQNSYYDLLKNGYPEFKTAAGKGDPNAKIWIDEFRELGTKLSFKQIVD
jgi:hypothetical protein